MYPFRKIREQARVSRDRAAVQAGVSYPLAKVFEVGGPEAVKDPEKRAALERVYDGFRTSVEAAA